MVRLVEAVLEPGKRACPPCNARRPEVRAPPRHPHPGYAGVGVPGWIFTTSGVAR